MGYMSLTYSKQHAAQEMPLHTFSFLINAWQSFRSKDQYWIPDFSSVRNLETGENKVSVLDQVSVNILHKHKYIEEIVPIQPIRH